MSTLDVKRRPDDSRARTALAQMVAARAGEDPYARLAGDGLDFRGADLSGLSLSGADLQDARLRGADLTRARLLRTFLDGALLAEAA